MIQWDPIEQLIIWAHLVVRPHIVRHLGHYEIARLDYLRILVVYAVVIL